MKKTILFGLLACFILPLSAQSGLIRVSTNEAEVNRASTHYFARLTFKLDRLLVEGKIAAYRDAELKEKMNTEQFIKETRIQYPVQMIDPMTPDDPYSLVDTLIWDNQSVRSSEYLLWKDKSIEVSTNNKDGKATYYLSVKEIEKQNLGAGYTLCALFSNKFGQVNTGTLAIKSYAFLKTWTQPFFQADNLSPFADPALKQAIQPEDLKMTKTLQRGEREMTYQYFPLSIDSCQAIYLSYNSQTEEDEFELENYSAALLYVSGNNAGLHSWYWASFESVKKLYTKDEWEVLMAIQSYTMKRKIFPSYEYLEY